MRKHLNIPQTHNSRTLSFPQSSSNHIIMYMNILDISGTLDTLDTLDTLVTFNILDTLDSLDSMDNLDTISNLDFLDTLDTLILWTLFWPKVVWDLECFWIQNILGPKIFCGDPIVNDYYDHLDHFWFVWSFWEKLGNVKNIVNLNLTHLCTNFVLVK